MRQQQNEANTLLQHPYALTFTLYHTHRTTAHNRTHIAMYMGYTMFACNKYFHNIVQST